MTKKIKHSLIFIFLLSLMIPFAERQDAYAKDISPLSVNIYTNKTCYYPGDPVKLTLIATNRSQKTFSSTYGSGQSYDFIVYDKQKNTIWQWSHGKVFTMAIRPFSLPPGKSKKFTCLWDQKDNYGEPVKNGRYTLVGWLAVSPQCVSLPRTITIKSVN